MFESIEYSVVWYRYAIPYISEMPCIYGSRSECVCLYTPVYLAVVVCLYSISPLTKGRVVETVSECIAGKVLSRLTIYVITHQCIMLSMRGYGIHGCS